MLSIRTQVEKCLVGGVGNRFEETERERREKEDELMVRDQVSFVGVTGTNGFWGGDSWRKKGGEICSYFHAPPFLHPNCPAFSKCVPWFVIRIIHWWACLLLNHSQENSLQCLCNLSRKWEFPYQWGLPIKSMQPNVLASAQVLV